MLDKMGTFRYIDGVTECANTPPPLTNWTLSEARMATPKMHPESESRKPLTVERLRELLNYDTDTGAFTWKVSRGSVKVGDTAGTLHESDGYIRTKVDGIGYQTHRLAWLHENGEWPPAGCEIDHIDRDRTNNRIANLRLATISQNQCNRGRAGHNKSGYKGVTSYRGRWRATITLNRKQKYLGLFDSPELAFSAYCAAAEVLHGAFVRQK
jgi:hypothetical protein